MNSTASPRKDRLRALNFAEPLESDFVGHYALAAARTSGPALLLAVVLVGFWALLDYRLRVGGLSQPVIWIKLAYIVPALLVSLALHLTELSGKASARLALSSSAAFALGFAGLMFAAPGADLPGVILATQVLTVYLYLLSGLRLLPAICCAVPLMVVAQWTASVASMPALDAAMNGAFLALTNAVCAVAVYRFEHAARSAFLEREVKAILHGNDADTGIPNRASLERRYQLIGRQGAREGRGLVLLIAEVIGFDAHAKARGSRAAASDLRRIAHAILQSVRRPLDFAARLEGARFGVLLYDVQPEHLPHVMRLIRENVAMLDIELNNQHGPSVLALTIGAAIAAPGAPRDLRTLMTVAELALEEARDPENQGIAVRAVAPDSGGEAVTTGPWKQLSEKSGT